MGEEVRLGQRLAMMARASNVAAWAGHAWARYNEWNTLEMIAREAPLEAWPERIEESTRAAMEQAAQRMPAARQVIFLAARLAPRVEAGQVCVEIGAQDQLRATLGPRDDWYEYRPRRRRFTQLHVSRDEWGQAVGAMTWGGGRKGRDIARVVAAALAADPSAKYCIQEELARILRGARAVEFAVRILDGGNAGHILAR